MAFTKRLCELGFTVNNAGKGGFKNLDELLECVCSSASDAEKAYLVFKGIDRDLAKVNPSASDAERPTTSSAICSARRLIPAMRFRSFSATTPSTRKPALCSAAISPRSATAVGASPPPCAKM
jgi:hypothetical protein